MRTPCPFPVPQHQSRFPVSQTTTLINHGGSLLDGDRIWYRAALRPVTLTVKALPLPQMLVQLAATGFICLNILVNPLVADGAANALTDGTYLLWTPLPTQPRFHIKHGIWQINRFVAACRRR